MTKNTTTRKPLANRHERRRATKMGSFTYMSLDEILKMPSGCSWDGCDATTSEPHKHGWSSLLLYKGKTQLSFTGIDPRLMNRDCVLCPEHARYLDEHLLIDIGGALRNVEGTA